jgi:DNA-directed RNA polymerase specialized sigma subunit
MKKLNSRQVAKIVELVQAQDMDRDDIAEMFGITEVYVGQLAYVGRSFRSGWSEFSK